MAPSPDPAGRHSDGHAHFCGIDHHSGQYTPQQRADLARVLGFNRRLAAAFEECRDVSAVEKLLDPDPLRYMWVDEGAGRLGEFLDRADEALAAAGKLPGHTRVPGQPLPAAAAAARPCVAVSPRGDLVSAWVEWHKDRGEQVMAVVRDAGGRSAEAVSLSGPPADCYRPAAVFDQAGRAWVCFSRAGQAGVGV